MKIFLMVTAVILLAPAHTWAATIDFTFTNTSIGDVVTGEIDGLTIGATSSASAVSITGYMELSSGAPYSFPTPLSITSITNNSFTLNGTGALTAADFTGEGFFGTNGSNVAFTIERLLPNEDIGSVFQNIFPNSGPIVQTGGDFGQLDYEPMTATTAVPETSSSTILTLGLAALAFICYRRRTTSDAGRRLRRL